MRWRIAVLSFSVIVACALAQWTPLTLKAQEQKAEKAAEKKDPEKKDPEKKDSEKKDPAGEKPKEEAKPPAVNPLQNLFQKLMPRQPNVPPPLVPRRENRP